MHYSILLTQLIHHLGMVDGRKKFHETSIEQKFARLKPHLNHHYHWAIAMAVKINNAPGNWEKLTEAN